MKTTANEIVTQGQKRSYLQYGGGGPDNAITFAGQDGQYMVIEGLSLSQSGGVDPIYVPDPRRLKKYKAVGKSETAPDLPTATIKLLEKHGAIPRALLDQQCPINVYELTGNCKDLSDFDHGWTDYVLIYSGGIVTNVDGGDRQSWDSDDQIENSLDVTFDKVYPIGALSFGDNATSLIDREVIDVVYYPYAQCSECGPANDGTKWAYALTKPSGAGSPGLPAEVVYTVDGWANATEATITGIGATAIPVAIDVVGDKLVVLTQETNGAIYYATINSATGAVGTFTKVTTGFVANAQPTDMWASNPREVWFSALGGYIYKSTDITSGVTVASAAAATSTNLYRIHGADTTIVAVGDGATVILSQNGGQSWATTSASPTGGNLRALAVKNNRQFWVGSVNGTLSYTKDGANSWTIQGFSGSGSGTLYDIVFATDDVIFFSHSTSTPSARIFASINGGRTFTNQSPRIQNLPTANYLNRLAVPNSGMPGVDANAVLAGGLSGGGTDGVLFLGYAARI